jgi:hypothetical protein
MVTIRAADPGKTLREVAAFQKTTDHFGNDWAQKTILPDKTGIIMELEIVKMLMKQVPQRRSLRLSRLINRCRISPVHGKPFAVITDCISSTIGLFFPIHRCLTTVNPRKLPALQQETISY